MNHEEELKELKKGLDWLVKKNEIFKDRMDLFSDEIHRREQKIKPKKGWLTCHDFHVKFRFISDSAVQSFIRKNPTIIKHEKQKNRYYMDPKDFIEQCFHKNIGGKTTYNNLQKWRKFIPPLDKICRQIEDKQNETQKIEQVDFLDNIGV